MIKLVKLYFKERFKSIIVLSVLSIVSMIASLIIPYFNGVYIDVLIKHPNKKAVLNFALYIILIGIAGCVIGYFYNLFKIKIENLIIYESISNTIKHLQKIPYLILCKFNPTYLNQRISSDTGTIVSFIIDNYLNIVLNGLNICVILFIVFTINAYIFLVAVSFIPIYLFLYIKLKKPMYKAGINFKEKQNIFFNSLNEQYFLIEDIKVNGNFNFWGNRLKNLSISFIKEIMLYNRIIYLFYSIDTIISLFFSSAVLIIGGFQIIKGKMTIGEFTIVNTYFRALLKSVEYYFNLGKSYQDFRVSFDRLKQLDDIEEETNGTLKLEQIDQMNLNVTSHEYIKEKDIKFDFHSNKIYGILGVNGAGKTTLIKILIGIIKDERNKITYNGFNYDKVDLYDARLNIISIMKQDISYKSLNVSEILGEVLGEDVNANLVRNTIYLNQLSDLFESDSFHITNLLDKKITDLSGGERQKVMLLYALLKKASVYIFDEPTSNLDINTIVKLKLYLQQLKEGKIIIIITHDAKLNDLFDETIHL